MAGRLEQQSLLISWLVAAIPIVGIGIDGIASLHAEEP